MENLELAQNTNFNVEQIPVFISNQFTALNKVKQRVEEATTKADNANKKAQEAKQKGAGLFKNKGAIESLQEAAVGLADSQVAGAEANSMSFEYMRALTEMIKRLFALGVSNIAANRCVVRELKLKLEGASQEELDELARQEILGVIQQLKAQEDIMEKQEKLDGRVKNLEDQNEINIQIIEAGNQKDFEQDAEIRRQAEKDAEHDERFDASDEWDRSQDEELARQASKDAEHDEQIKALEDKVTALENTCNQLNETIKALDKSHIDHEAELRAAIDSRFTRGASIASAIVGALGFIAAIIGFFL